MAGTFHDCIDGFIYAFERGEIDFIGGGVPVHSMKKYLSQAKGSAGGGDRKRFNSQELFLIA